MADAVINQRVYYPIQAIGFATLGTVHATGAYRAAKGVQSIGLNTNFTLDPVYQLGQIELYEYIENTPDIELTCEKVIDGFALLEHLATPAATVATLAGRYNTNRAQVAIAYYNINQDFASGMPLSTVVMSGMYVSAINWNMPIEGNMTESLTLVGNDKRWYSHATGTPAGLSGTPWLASTLFTGTESPVTASGGVLRRENVNMTDSRWPTDIPGISGNSLSGVNPVVTDGFAARIQSVTVGVNLGRTSLFQLGRKTPYFRYAEFPTEVTCAIETTANEHGDFVNALETQDNLTDQYIKIVLEQGITLDLGIKNKLQSITSAGGDTGGGNVTTTFNYSNFNSLKITQPARDPAGLS